MAVVARKRRAYFCVMKRCLAFTLSLLFCMVLMACKKEDAKDTPVTPVTPVTPKPAPKADFSFAVTNEGILPGIVNFTDASTNGTTYTWTFGDGQSSAEKNPQHQFAAAGTYQVKLLVAGEGGKDSVVKQVVITEKGKPLLDKSVVVYLITPRDKKYNADYYTVLKNTILELQTWYKNQMGNNKTFVLNSFVVDTLTGGHDSTWYNSNNGSISGTDPRFYGYYNTYNDVQQLLGNKFNTSNYVYFVYVAAPGGGAGAGGFCAMGDQDLKGLLGTNPENLNPKRWIGGGGHELGHAFGLAHPDNQDPAAIMWTGYANYPNCILLPADKAILNASPFFR